MSELLQRSHTQVNRAWGKPPPLYLYIALTLVNVAAAGLWLLDTHVSFEVILSHVCVAFAHKCM
ncbi:hypothetical protein RchiOBHm_Chr3g0479471 [Rosa chinensis]|uniref:Uncharacterized protein n=1 Tax=Rosa chinensis TaxID=74649 RepID=A0A2P6RDH0_ROSCH|nr:hypothetical protein RchiOBHm_Chr3g0479471 [Rosa chinensis]